MADWTGTPQINLGNTNAVAQGAVAGTEVASAPHQWAYQKAVADAQQTNAQAHLQQVQEMKRQFDIQTNRQMFDQYNDFATLPNSKLKNTKAQNWKDQWVQAGFLAPDKADEWIANSQDEATQLKYSQFLQQVTGIQAKDPDAFDSVMENMRGVFGKGVVQGMLDQMTTRGMMVNGMLQRQLLANQQSDVNNQRSADARKYSADVGYQGRIAGIGAGFIKDAQKQYNSSMKQIQFSLDGAARATSTLKEGMQPDGSIKITPQIVNVLSQEEARLVTQKSNFGEGSAEGVRIGSYIQSLKGFIQKVQDAPNGVLSPENAQQMTNFYSLLKDEYMGQADRTANTLMGGATDSQRQAIIGRHQAFQRQYGKRFGGWTGPGLEIGEGPGSPASQAGSASVSQPGAQPAASGAGLPAATATNQKQGAAPAQGAGGTQPNAIDPGMMQKAGQLFQQYKSFLKADPAKAKLMLDKMRQVFPPEIKQRLGIQ